MVITATLNALTSALATLFYNINHGVTASNSPAQYSLPISPAFQLDAILVTSACDQAKNVMAAAALYAAQPADRSARSGATRGATGGSRQEDAKRARGSNNAAGKSGNKP